MAVERLNPEGMLSPVPYAHVAVASGARHVAVAGQVSHDADGTIVALGDVGGQLAQALRNADRGLAAAGATFADSVRIRVYVAGWRPELMDRLMSGFTDVAEELALPQPLPPATLIGVQALYEPDVLVEVEVDAVVE